MATSVGLFGLDFWWELAALVTIMLLGHWQEMKAIGQARGALTALAALLPDEAERVGEDGAVEVSWRGPASLSARPSARCSCPPPPSWSPSTPNSCAACS